MKLPSTETAAMKVVEKEVFAQRGQPFKEATAFPIELVKAMEKFVVKEDHPAHARVFMWCVLCMSFASFRFDGAIHFKPRELEVKPDGLLGVSWEEEPSSWFLRSRSPLPRGSRSASICSTGIVPVGQT